MNLRGQFLGVFFRIDSHIRDRERRTSHESGTSVEVAALATNSADGVGYEEVAWNEPAKKKHGKKSSPNSDLWKRE